jgi:hypothetical protein
MMQDRYDPRSEDGRDRSDSWDRSVGSWGGASERECDGRSWDVFTRELDLPRGRDREHVRLRDHVYELDGSESRALATIGAFRVVAESDLRDIGQQSQGSRRCLKRIRSASGKRTWPSSYGGRRTGGQH